MGTCDQEVQWEAPQRQGPRSLYAYAHLDTENFSTHPNLLEKAQVPHVKSSLLNKDGLLCKGGPQDCETHLPSSMGPLWPRTALQSLVSATAVLEATCKDISVPWTIAGRNQDRLKHQVLGPVQERHPGDVEAKALSFQSLGELS